VVVRPAPVAAAPKRAAEPVAEPEKPAAPEAPRLSPTLENFTFESFEPPDA
jgi:hypothetical protein